MKGLVDIVRISPQPEGAFDWLQRFRNNVDGEQPVKLGSKESNGYWLQLAGLATA
jgi:hypothetical protein